MTDQPSEPIGRSDECNERDMEDVWDKWDERDERDERGERDDRKVADEWDEGALVED